MMWWSFRLHVEWNDPAPGKGEQWWKLWKKSTGERMERDIEVSDIMVYALIGIFWAIAYVAR